MKSYNVFVTAFVPTATVCAMLVCADPNLPRDISLHRLVSVIVPFDVLFRMAGWSAFGQLAINTLCILAWSTATGLAATWTTPRLVRYAHARRRDLGSGRYQCSIRELLILLALLAVLARFAGPTVVRQVARWRIPARMGMVRGVTQVRITKLEPDEEGPQQTIIATDTSDIELITSDLAACVRVEGYNKCMPAQYQIELLSGNRVMLDISPTECCGIFGSGGRYYRDTSHAFRDVVDLVYVRESTQNGKVPAKTMSPSPSPQ